MTSLCTVGVLANPTIRGGGGLWTQAPHPPAHWIYTPALQMARTGLCSPLTNEGLWRRTPPWTETLHWWGGVWVPRTLATMAPQVSHSCQGHP